MESRSIALMQQIQNRYNTLSPKKSGNPTIQIAATLPAMVPTPGTAFG